MLIENKKNLINLYNYKFKNKNNILLKTNNTNLKNFFPKISLNSFISNNNLKKKKYIKLTGKIYWKTLVTRYFTLSKKNNKKFIFNLSKINIKNPIYSIPEYQIFNRSWWYDPHFINHTRRQHFYYYYLKNRRRSFWNFKKINFNKSLLKNSNKFFIHKFYNLKQLNILRKSTWNNIIKKTILNLEDLSQKHRLYNYQNKNTYLINWNFLKQNSYENETFFTYNSRYLQINPFLNNKFTQNSIKRNYLTPIYSLKYKLQKTLKLFNTKKNLVSFEKFLEEPLFKQNSFKNKSSYKTYLLKRNSILRTNLWQQIGSYKKQRQLFFLKRQKNIQFKHNHKLKKKNIISKLITQSGNYQQILTFFNIFSGILKKPNNLNETLNWKFKNYSFGYFKKVPVLRRSINYVSELNKLQLKDRKTLKKQSVPKKTKWPNQKLITAQLKNNIQFLRPSKKSIILRPFLTRQRIIQLKKKWFTKLNGIFLSYRKLLMKNWLWNLWWKKKLFILQKPWWEFWRKLRFIKKALRRTFRKFYWNFSRISCITFFKEVFILFKIYSNCHKKFNHWFYNFMDLSQKLYINH